MACLDEFLYILFIYFPINRSIYIIFYYVPGGHLQFVYIFCLYPLFLNVLPNSVQVQIEPFLCRYKVQKWLILWLYLKINNHYINATVQWLSSRSQFLKNGPEALIFILFRTGDLTHYESFNVLVDNRYFTLAYLKVLLKGQ